MISEGIGVWLGPIRDHIRKLWPVYALLLLIVLGLITARMIRNHREDASIQSSATKAEQAKDDALKHEGAADGAADQAATIEAQRVEQAKRVDEARQRSAASRAQLTQTRKAHDEAQTGNIRIDRSGNLDDRWNRIRAKLDQLYPDTPRGRTFSN